MHDIVDEPVTYSDPKTDHLTTSHHHDQTTGCTVIQVDINTQMYGYTEPFIKRAASSIYPYFYPALPPCILAASDRIGV